MFAHASLQVPLSQDPFPLAALGDAGKVLCQRDREELLKVNVYQRDLCCLSSFSKKIRSCHPTEKDAADDGALMRGFVVWAKHTIVENMALERLMALFRNAGRSTDTFHKMTCDRFLPMAVLLQVLQIHRSAGGLEPRGLMREDLVSQSLPIKGRKKQAGIGMMRGFIEFHKEKVQQRKKLAGSLDREGTKQESRELGARWKLLSAAEKKPYQDRQLGV